ncbi:MAG: hypothetical protein ACRYGF_00705 [Janthinobacterium lividum]
MPKPLTIDEILDAREDKLNKWKDHRNKLNAAFSSLSDTDKVTTTINVPSSATVFSVVCWNVVTYTAGKSDTSRYANRVINHVLDELSVDVCILLETSADSNVNMNAIETDTEGTGKKAKQNQLSDPDLDMDEEDGGGEENDSGDSDNMEVETTDDAGDSDESDEADDVQGSGGDPLRYIQIASDPTGKRWVPPDRIYIYSTKVAKLASLSVLSSRRADLIEKMARLTGTPPDQEEVKKMLKIAASNTVQKAGVAVIDTFLDAQYEARKEEADEINRENDEEYRRLLDGRKRATGVKKPVPVTVKNPTVALKEKRWLVRIGQKLQANPSLFQEVESLTVACQDFLSHYKRYPKWRKSHAVDPKTDQPSDAWKNVLYQAEMVLLLWYYELRAVDTNFNEVPLNWNQLSSISADDNWRLLLHLRRCPACNALLGKGTCDAIAISAAEVRSTMQIPSGTQLGLAGVTCKDLGPYSTSLSNLRQTVAAVVAKYFGAVHESYSVLVRPASEVTDASSQGTWLFQKQVNVMAGATKLLMRTPDVVTFAPPGSTAQPTRTPGTMLKFQAEKSGFYGRNPFCIPLRLWLPDTQAHVDVALATFHGPFGGNNVDDIKLRADAMREMLQAGVFNTNQSLQDTPNALVMGDFNLNYHPTYTGDKEALTIASALYKDFEKVGFEPMIRGVNSSLTSFKGNWTKSTTDTSSLTSSAYDNIFLKGIPPGTQYHVKGVPQDTPYHVQSGVIDVLAYIEDNLKKFPLEDDQKPDGYDGLADRNKAFYIYREFVSDHLPVICDLIVREREVPQDPKLQELLQTARQKSADKLFEQTRLPVASDAFQVDIYYEAVLDVSPAFGPDDYGPKFDLKGKVIKGQHVLVGTIAGQLNDHLMITCSPATGGTAWLAYKPKLPSGEPLRPRVLQAYLRLHPVGMRVELLLLNARIETKVVPGHGSST